MLQRLLDGGFSGAVHPVNPQAESVLGRRAWPSVEAIPDEVDLVVVCVPAPAVRAVVLDCARKHVHGLVIVSAGFSDAGADGARLEREVVELAHRHGMRVIGPNSMGVVNTAADVSMQATFVGVPALPGAIGVSSQSGTLGAAIIGHARRLGLGISTFVSLGNKPDVSNNDLLQYWEEDEATRLALLHLDSFGNPQNFSRITRRLTRVKPVVAVKSGRSVQLAHTPNGLSLEASLDALLAQTGVIRVDTLEQLFDVAVLLSHQPVARGGRLAIVANSWGPASLATDAVVGAGLELAAPDRGERPNPLDLGYAAGPEAFSDAVGRVSQDPDVDAVLVLCTPPVPADLDRLAETIEAAADASPVPVVASYLGLTPSPPRNPAPGRHVPVFEFPEAAVHALGRIARYGRWLDRDPGTLPDASLVDVGRVRALVDGLLPTDGGLTDTGWVDSDAAAAFMEAAGMSVVARRVVRDVDGAIAAAEALGWPVVLKASGVERPAKTEAGGIAVDVHGPDELRHAHARMEELLGAAMHPAVVQEMAPSGVDVRIGIVRHPQVGSVLTVWVDGRFGAIAPDDALQVLPCSDLDAERVLAAAGLPAALEAVVVRGEPLDEEAVGDADRGRGGAGAATLGAGGGRTGARSCDPRPGAGVGGRRLGDRRPTPARAGGGFGRARRATPGVVRHPLRRGQLGGALGGATGHGGGAFGTSATAAVGADGPWRPGRQRSQPATAAPNTIPATCASHATREVGSVRNCESRKKPRMAHAGR